MPRESSEFFLKVHGNKESVDPQNEDNADHNEHTDYKY